MSTNCYQTTSELERLGFIHDSLIGDFESSCKTCRWEYLVGYVHFKLPTLPDINIPILNRKRVRIFEVFP